MDRALLLMLSFLGFGTIFAALHACIVESSRSELEAMARERRTLAGLRAGAVGRILNDVDGHARATAITRIVCNLAVAVSSVFFVASLRKDDSPNLGDALIGVIGSAGLLWVFTVGIAEALGRHAPERVVFLLAPLVRATYLLQSPLAPIARVLDTIVRKLSGVEKTTKREAAAEELLETIEDAQREGTFDPDEKRMIEAVVDFKHRTVEQIMTPRSEIEALEYTNNLGQITAFVRKVRHSRIPVYKSGGGLDEIIGFFYVKDLLRWLAGDVPRGAPGAPKVMGGVGAAAAGGFELKGILRPALHVPDSKTVRELADEFVAKKVHAAVVVDEYGATTGLVTMEDIVEEVFGDIQDEYEKAEDAPPRVDVRVDDRLADIDARAYVADANEALAALGARIPESDDYDTVGGFVLSTLGHMPEVNESFAHGLMQVSVLEAAPTRVIKVRVQVKELDSESDTSAEASAERGK